MNGWLHTNFLILQELLMFSDIASMHYNAFFSEKSQIKYTQFLNV